MTHGEQRIDQQAEAIEALQRRLEQLSQENRQLALMAENTLVRRLDAAIETSAESVRSQAQSHADAASAAAAEQVRRAAHAHAEAAADAVLATVRAHADSGDGDVRRELSDAVAALRRELRRSVSLPPAGAPATSATLAGATVHDTAAVPDDFYIALEDRFRGSPELVASRQRHYLPYVTEATAAGGSVLDIGCGRGEWLAILAGAGIEASGIDTNLATVVEAVEAGHRVVQADAIGYLRSCPDDSLAVVTMFQVVEHLEFGDLLTVFGEVLRTLAPGGVMIAETPNGANLRVGATTFWLDPTHRRPLHPELLGFVASYCGFGRIEGIYANRLGPQRSGFLGDAPGQALAELSEAVDGPGDFCLVAYK